MPLSRGSAVARRRSHKAGSTWSGMLVSFNRVQWLDASRQGDSSRLSRPYLGHPQRVLEADLNFLTARWASLTPVLEIGCRTLSAGQPATSRGFHGRVPWLTREGRGRGGLPFCPLGAPFQAGVIATWYRRRIRSVLSVRRKKTVRWRIYGGLYLIYWICPLVVVAYKYPMALPPFSLPPFAFILALSLLPS